MSIVRVCQITDSECSRYCYGGPCKLEKKVMSKTTPEEAADLVSKALRRAWQLGQIYWQQADHEFTSQHKKADETQRKFDQLIEETRAALIDEARGVDAEPVGYICPARLKNLQAGRELSIPLVHKSEALLDGGAGYLQDIPVYAHPAPSQPAAPVELPVVAEVVLVDQGVKRGLQVGMLTTLKVGEKLVKLSDAQAAIAAGRKV